MQKVSRREFLKMSGFITAATLLGDIDDVFAKEVGPVFGSVPEIDLNSAIEKVASACWVGKQDCALTAWKVDGKVIKFEGNVEDPRTAGALCPKGQANISGLYDPYRIKAPLKRTNAKGTTGTWQEVSWDEAYTEIAAKLNEVKQADIKRFIYLSGRGKGAQWHGDAFNSAFGTKNKTGHGSLCSDAGYRSSELMFDTSGCNEVDFRYCDYFISWGWNITGSGGPHLCQITWPQQIIDAKKRGMKVVTIDPQIRSGLHFVDEWVQIKPGHDLAFFLAMANVLISNNTIDEEYLKKYTNAASLVGADGLILLDADGKELVWDPTSSSAKPFDVVTDPALTGEYTVNDVKYKPAFELYKTHIAQYTPAWAEGICGVSASKITAIAAEFGQKAKIGQKTTVDGKELPHRPVAIGYYHVAQSELGTPTCMAANQVTMLVGAVDVAGSTRTRQGGQTGPLKKLSGYKDLAKDPSKIKDTPDGPSLDGSKFFPIGSGGYSIIPQVLANPTKYGIPYQAEQLVMWVHMTNPVMSKPAQATTIDMYKKLSFMVVVDAFLSETADLCADYILPAATIDKYEGPLGNWTGYEMVSVLRFPVVDTMFSSKADAQIYIDMAEKLNIMQKYVETLNSKLSLPDNLKLDTSKKPTIEDALDRWAQSKGKSLDWFKQNGVLSSTNPPEKNYAYLWSPAYGGIRHQFYSDILVRLGSAIKAKGVTAPYVNDYNAFPTWRNPIIDSSPQDYDLYLMSHKKVWHKQSRTAHNVLLNLLDPGSPAEMHTSTASAKSINDGDDIWVESHNAVTGAILKVKAKAKVIEGIIPGVVSIAHHHGNFSHPISKARDLGASPNTIFHSGEGYVDMTGNQSFVGKVKIYKA
ncbi:MAG: molybdopterin-dependent oxidoreductase [Candidatus Melainabacteria bacterium]|nr:molybdopterin-dependent oxidoreductase [Candidatus Melainabacteria bacterium]